MSEWQPIETAPKDGTRVLVGSFGARTNKPGRIRADWYRRPEDKAGFIGFGLFNSHYFPATHWMSLPNPPEQP